MMRYPSPRRRRSASRTRFDVVLTQRARHRWVHRLYARRWVVAIVLLVISVAAGLRWYSGESWRIADIRVQNNTGVPVEAIIGASGLQGDHFHFADLDAAARSVDDLPGVEAATVTCRWEWRTVCVIVIQPAQPMAVWQSQSGNVWNDFEGRVQVAREGVPARLTIRVEEGPPPALGSRLDRRLLRALNELIAAQPNVTRYSYSPRFGLMWTDERRRRVRLGDAPYDGAMSDKLRLARALQRQLTEKGIEVRALDVRFPEAPYYESRD